jgi:hypothetical protein
MKNIFLILIFFFALNVQAQDTIKVMTYNLLNYNYYPSYCTLTNNNVNAKDGYLKTIFTYIKPDIFGVNEIGSGNSTALRILDSVLNRNGISSYRKANYVNSNSSTIISTIFYNSDKVKLYSQNYLPTGVRDIMIYKFYYNSPDLATLFDTVYFTCVQMHLKAGSTTADQSDRAAETSLLMNYLNSINSSNLGNVVVMGDFNVQSSTETCFQNLINYSNSNIRFYDPVNKLGSWYNNSAFALYHTQSTSVDISNDCKASGGMDDRFDFILASFYIMNNISKVSYIPNSYSVIGQDGNRFNQSINSPANYSVPSTVVTALQNMSDHLPVTLKLKINQTAHIGINDNLTNYQTIKYTNPVSENEEIEIYSAVEDNYTVSVFNQLGNIMSKYSFKINVGYNYLTIPTGILINGLYYINISGVQRNSTIKVIKIQ